MALTKLNTLSLADDAITSAKIADNAIVTAAIADDAVTTAKTTVTSTNPNILINGDMAIAQRATSSTVTGIKTVDRWSAAWGGGGGITQSQVALTSGGAYDEGHRHAFKMAVTSANSANARYAQVNYKVESQQIRNSGWQYNSASSYVTISFWVKASLAGTYWLSFYCPDTNTQYYSTSFALSAATWTKITKTFPGGSNITFNDDTGNGLQIDIYLDYGTDLTASDATLNSWHTFASGKYMTDFAQSWFNTGSATFEVTGCKLEIGQSATTFEKPDYTTELKKCFRYYEKITNTTGFSMLGLASNTTAAYFDLYYEPKRANPSLVFPTASVTGNGVVALTANGSYPTDATGTLTATKIGKTSCRIDAESFGGLTDDGPSWLYWVAENSIEISAEL